MNDLNIKITPDEALALRNCVLARLVDLEQHKYQPEFDGEATALRRIGDRLERFIAKWADSDDPGRDWMGRPGRINSLDREGT